MAAFIGDSAEARAPAQHLADRRRAVALLPESPEAHFELGDYLLHSGAAHNIADHFVQGREELERSLTLDTQTTVVEHLLEIGMFMRDTARLRKYWSVYERVNEDSTSLLQHGIVAATILGDTRLLAALTRRAEGRPFMRGAVLVQARDAGLSFGEMERATAPLPMPVTNAQGINYERTRAQLLVITGRPSELSAMRAQARDSGVVRYLDYVTVMAGLFEGGDSAAATAAAERLAGTVPRDSAVQAAGICATTLWRRHLGQAPDYDGALLRRHRWAPCDAALALQDAWRSRAPDLDHRITTLDSMLRHHLANGGTSQWFENRILARVHEERGNRGAAISALRLMFRAFGTKITEPGDVREEGRLAALAGDAPAAIRAYRRYLVLRRDAEPALMPQRDSVVAELARLERR